MTKRQTLLTMRAQDSSSEQLPTRVERWQAVWTALGVSRPEAGLPERLISCYSEPQRHYHTLQHLGECLSWLDCLRELAQRPAEIELALWFHDAIYEVRRRDNEPRSADWAREALLRAGASNDVADRVHAMVMLTQHQRLPLTADEKLLIDIDLSILGAESARFAEYERQIELEYAWMEERQRRAGRLKILQVFLNREMIYQTTRVGELLEARARHNLQASVAALGQALTSSKP